MQLGAIWANYLQAATFNEAPRCAKMHLLAARLYAHLYARPKIHADTQAGLAQLEIPPALQEEMADRAGAHTSSIKAGHLTPITQPADVTKVILSAVDAAT
jgi:hypothetical protein